MADKSHQEQQERTPLLEWIVAAVGFLMVAGSIGFMVYQALTGDSSPPQIIIHLEAVQPIQDSYLVRIRAVNEGESTASGVVVEGKLTSESGEVEASDLTFDYLPAQSERRGGLYFSQDPRQFVLELRAKGYKEP